MITAPATTPLTQRGQAAFGVGTGVLTVVIQAYMNFLGGSVLAIVIMNLTSLRFYSTLVYASLNSKSHPQL